jgi:hypothetical protein
MMELNRNQYFMAGVLVLLLGIQFRTVDTFVLNERSTQIIAQRMNAWKQPQVASAGSFPAMIAASGPIANHRLKPPKWLGWCLISIGSVLVLHSLSLKKPGG